MCVFTEDVQKALEDVLELNSMFTPPLGDNEVRKATRSAERVYIDKVKEYKYKNSTLIELLEITEDEERYMTTIISNKEYRRRKKLRDSEYQRKVYDSQKAKEKYQEKLKSQGKLPKRVEVLERRKKIKDLLGQGLSRKDIYTFLNISLKTYKRDIRYLKEQGLI